jgi:hypothetical protein
MYRLLPGHFCRTAQQVGLGGVKNGDLLKAAAVDFDVFITSYQTSVISKTSLLERLQLLSFPQTNFGESNELRLRWWRR